MERGGNSHVVICDVMRRYGCRTSSSSSREKAVDEEDDDDDDDENRRRYFFRLASSLDYLTFDL